MIININDLKYRDGKKEVLKDFTSYTIAIYETHPEEDSKIISKLEVLELVGFAKGVKEDFIVDTITIRDQVHDFYTTPYFRAFLERCFKEDIDLILFTR